MNRSMKPIGMIVVGMLVSRLRVPQLGDQHEVLPPAEDLVDGRELTGEADGPTHAAGQVGGLDGVARQFDGLVIHRARLLSAGPAGAAGRRGRRGSRPTCPRDGRRPPGATCGPSCGVRYAVLLSPSSARSPFGSDCTHYCRRTRDAFERREEEEVWRPMR